MRLVGNQPRRLSAAGGRGPSRRACIRTTGGGNGRLAQWPADRFSEVVCPRVPDRASGANTRGSGVASALGGHFMSIMRGLAVWAIGLAALLSAAPVAFAGSEAA